ncbi:F-box and leucine-rich protein 22 [Sphaerodactylus townsendi]|uniref:F-box and leucine-rich protein 22 n=1 Tax=Sphaerodactylus townsendi TaxID=933632 RepID=A0ACB8E5A2_9SAUR|nr:F-box and leucine-rich protein 22 [Sphaerodactylus townsendi]
MHITQLNGECLLHLFSFLDKNSRKNLGQTCRCLMTVFREPSLWPLLQFHSPAELTKGNFVLGPALRRLSVCWHSSRVKVCNIEDWLKNAFQRDVCSTHERTVNDFLLQVCKRCPNLLALTLSGCGHVTDDALALLFQSCPCLRTLQLENCVRISDRTLEAAALHADSLQTLQVDFCRNITQAGLRRFRKKRPAVTLTAERSADMIPDQKPGNCSVSERAAKKLLWC